MKTIIMGIPCDECGIETLNEIADYYLDSIMSRPRRPVRETSGYAKIEKYDNFQSMKHDRNEEVLEKKEIKKESPKKEVSPENTTYASFESFRDLIKLYASQEDADERFKKLDFIIDNLL